MDPKDQRIAELEAEVQRLNVLLEEPEVLVCRKVKIQRSHPHTVEDLIQRARRQHLRNFTSGMRMLAAVVCVALVVAAGVFLLSRLQTEGNLSPPPADPESPVASSR